VKGCRRTMKTVELAIEGMTCEGCAKRIRETLEKEILGIIAGKCNYIEQMPNGGKMECKYTENERKAVSQYYKDVEAAESFGTGTNVDLGSGKQKTTYTIDGKEVENPLQEAMNNGVCVISGY